MTFQDSMEDKRKQFLEAFKIRIKEARGKTRTEGKIIPSFKNPVLERIKEAREKAIANGTAKPMPKMDGRMAEMLKKMKEVRTNKMNEEN